MASSAVCFLNNEVIGIFSSPSPSSSSSFSSFFLPHGIVIYRRRLSLFLIITCFLQKFVLFTFFIAANYQGMNYRL